MGTFQKMPAQIQQTYQMMPAQIQQTYRMMYQMMRVMRVMSLISSLMPAQVQQTMNTMKTTTHMMQFMSQTIMVITNAAHECRTVYCCLLDLIFDYYHKCL